MSLRIISDIHGRYDTYLDLTKGTSHTLQLGDLGYDYNKISRLDPLKHKFFGGNHDCYDVYHNIPYSLGDYGKVRLNGMKFFFIRGAFSIDWQIRTVFDLAEGKKSWWANEQLNYQDMSSALKEYKRTKPSIMFTHSCPRVIAKLIGRDDPLIGYGYNPETFSTNTQELLQECFEYHQPDFWTFGHFHKNWTQSVNGTKFTCLEAEGYIDL